MVNMGYILFIWNIYVLFISPVYLMVNIPTGLYGRSSLQKKQIVIEYPHMG